MNPTLSLTKDPIPSLIKKIAIPASVGTFFQTMFNIVDTFLLEKFLQKHCQLLLNLSQFISL